MDEVTREIWHPINGYIRRVKVKKLPDHPMGRSVFRFVGDPRDQLLVRSRRRLRPEKNWTSIFSKRVDVEPKELPGYLRTLQLRGYIHAGHLEISRSPKKPGEWPASGSYEEYRLEICGVFRESFLSGNDGLWRQWSWNFNVVQQVVRRYSAAIRSLQAFVPNEKITAVQRRRYESALRVRSDYDPLFHYFVRYHRGDIVASANSYVTFPGSPFIPEKKSRLMWSLSKMLSGSWPSYLVKRGRPKGPTSQQQTLTHTIVAEYRDLKRRHPHDSDVALSRQIHSILLNVVPPIQGLPSPNRIRNIILKEKSLHLKLSR